MVNLKTIKKSNHQLDQYLKSFRPVAVFVGATNGIGRNSLRSFIRSTRAAGAKPRVYFVGRSRQRGDEIKAELESINPDGEYEFVCADVGEMAVVDDVCRDILKREKYVNLLFMSQGTAQHAAETSENLRLINAVIYYSKIRFAVNLLPLLKTAPGLRRVVSVFAAGLEGKVVPDDLDGNKSSLIAHRDNVASMLTLAMVKLSEDAPQVSWVHDFPGFVESGLWESAPGLLGVVMRTVVWALGRFFYMDPEECGQRQLFMATSARFPPSRSAAAAEAAGEDATASGVGLVDDLTVATALDGKPGGGNYSANEHGDTIPDKKVAMLRRYMTDGTKDVVWKHTMDTFRRVTGKEKL